MDNANEPLVSALAGGGELDSNTDEPLVSALAGGGESDSNADNATPQPAEPQAPPPAAPAPAAAASASVASEASVPSEEPAVGEAAAPSAAPAAADRFGRKHWPESLSKECRVAAVRDARRRGVGTGVIDDNARDNGRRYRRGIAMAK